MLNRSVLAAALAGFAGGVLGAYVVGHGGSVATAAPSATPVAVIAATRIRLVDERGRARAELALSPDGGPGLFFYDESGRNRMVLGLYAPREREDPFVVLNDPEQRAAGIFRLFGAQATPVVVLKASGADRSVFGLHPATHEPFLVNYAADGHKTAVFGSF
jgi:hypothetical protein